MLFAAMLGVSRRSSPCGCRTRRRRPCSLPIVDRGDGAAAPRAFTEGRWCSASPTPRRSAASAALIGTPANPIAIEFLETFAGRDDHVHRLVRLRPADGRALRARHGRLPLVADGRAGATRTAFAEARRGGAPGVRARAPSGDPRSVDRSSSSSSGIMIVWLTQTWHGLSPGIVAIAGVVALALLGNGEDGRPRADLLGRAPHVRRRASRSACSWCSRAPRTGSRRASTGWRACRPSSRSRAVAVLALALTAVASNTATAAMLVPARDPAGGRAGRGPGAARRSSWRSRRRWTSRS